MSIMKNTTSWLVGLQNILHHSKCSDNYMQTSLIFFYFLGLAMALL